MMWRRDTLLPRIGSSRKWDVEHRRKLEELRFMGKAFSRYLEDCLGWRAEALGDTDADIRLWPDVRSHEEAVSECEGATKRCRPCEG